MFNDLDAICKMKNVKKRELDAAQKLRNSGLLLLAKGHFNVFYRGEMKHLHEHKKKMKPVHKELKKTVKKK